MNVHEMSVSGQDEHIILMYDTTTRHRRAWKLYVGCDIEMKYNVSNFQHYHQIRANQVALCLL